MIDPTSGSMRRFRPVWLWVALGVAVFVVANTHLVYVAISSQPDCVSHIKDKGVAPGQYRAATSAC